MVFWQIGKTCQRAVFASSRPHPASANAASASEIVLRNIMEIN
jgi:hypothetical protein